MHPHYLCLALSLALTANGLAGAPFALQEAYLKASNTSADDQFGFAVALSGDTAVIGAPGEASSATGVDGSQSNNDSPGAGAAYVFVRDPGGTWTQQAYLKASKTDRLDFFGSSVAISGNTIVIGSPGEDSAATGVDGNFSDNQSPGSGAVYVFTRTGSAWTQQAYLKASNTGAGDEFGAAVAISGDLVIAGAPDESSDATGINGNQENDDATWSGAAYIFTRINNTWSQQAYLKASNTDEFDSFGGAVALSGNTAVVGARREDSAATGIGGVEGSNDAADSGATYIFTRDSGGLWSQQAYLKASNTGASDEFGRSVALSEDTAVVGAWGEDSAATGIAGDQNDENAPNSGATYIFTRDSSGVWCQQAYLKPSNTDAADGFGVAVATSGDAVLVGSLYEDSAATGTNGNAGDNTALDSGAAYLFHRGATGWSQLFYLKPSNTGAHDVFANAVALSGSRALAGAVYEDSPATGVNGPGGAGTTIDSGASYVIDLGLPLPFRVTGSNFAGGNFTIQFTAAENLTGWRVKGSTNLVSFPDDKTADAVFTEPTPGNYQAVVDLSGAPNRYFLRIER